jgi:diguanylate cyclase (GGDEF)-like protein
VLFINRIPTDIATVFADEDRLVQILHNLIGNAAKFTDRGSITISVDRIDQALAVHVADTGIGIPADKLEHVFTSFMQVDGSVERKYGGTGLGLSITRQLVKLHGGDMSVQSVFGEGSTFTFTLPIVDEAVTAEVSLIQDESRHIPDYGYLLVSHDDAHVSETKTDKNIYEHILVVDDDPINRLVLVNFLSLRNYRISEAVSGEEAIAFIADGGAVDLVLLDIMMPRMSGYQTCKALRKTFPAHELPIILLTARSQTSDLVMGFDVGANDFLTKPVTKEELLARVATHLQLRDVTRNLDSKVAERTEELQRKNLGLRQTQLELESAYKKLEQASLSDPLTGLHNRRFLNKFLAADVAIVEREYLNWTKPSSEGLLLEKPTESDFIFIMLDVDYFKSVNDSFGHGAGDHVLEQFGVVLKTALRESDYLVRWGGEEFLVVVRFTVRTEAAEMAERIRQVVASYSFDIGNGQMLQKTCSIGFACYPFYEQAPSVMTWEQVVDTADRALYAAKKSGRNCCVGLAAGDAADIQINPAVDENLPALITQEAIAVIHSNISSSLQW